MIRWVMLAGAVFCASTCGAQSTASSAPPPSDPSKAAAQAQPVAPAAPKDQAGKSDQAKKKAKKVWTNEEISNVRGNISVVGDPSQSSASSDSRQRNSDSGSDSGNNAERRNAIAGYREQLRQLRDQQDAIDKRISEFRNFKADNSSPTGGINVRNRYSMTPAEDQIRQLEEKKKQIQAKIDAIEEEARKNGIEPGELR